MIDGIDIPLETWGGLVLDQNPQNLPPGVSPDCQDVIFTEIGPRTRPGLGNGVFTAIGSRSFNYTKTFILPDGTMRALAYATTGLTSTLYQESTPGALSVLYEPLVENMFPVSVTQFGREWIAMGDGEVGQDIPRQFDGTNFDRVSQSGPGAAPSAIDENLSYAIVASPTGIVPDPPVAVTLLSESGNLCTVTASIADSAAVVVFHILKVGDPIKISAAGVAGYDGQFPIASINYAAPLGGFVVVTIQYVNTNTGLANTAVGTLTYGMAEVNLTTAITAGITSIALDGVTNPGWDGTYQVRHEDISGDLTIIYSNFALTASGGGTATVAGQSSAGVYKVSVVFVTRQGYITAPAFPASFTSLGGRRKIVTDIPVGPPNVVQRIVIFTGAGGGNFFYIPPGPTVPAIAVTVIPDNTTTTAIFDFSDVELFAGVSADALFRLIVLGQCAGVIDYGERMAWWGEKNKLNNFVNMAFDGGVDTNGFPRGWTPDPGFSAGGSVIYTGPILWAGTYKITTGSAYGLITQSAYQDPYQVPLIEPKRSYSVRARIRADALDGNVQINLQSTSLSYSSTGILTQGTVGSFGKYEAELTTQTFVTNGIVPADLVLQVFATGASGSNNWYIDEIEVFPTDTPVNSSLVRVSKAEDPESFDGIDGFLQVSQGDGFENRALFKLRDQRLYIAKNQGTYSTQDDGTNEPSGWSIDPVSSTVGAVSVKAIATGEDWAIIASRKGAYIFWGPEPVKISAEIQPLWDRINWAYGRKLWSRVNTQDRRVYLGVPLDGSQEINTVLHMDYQQLDDAPDIASADPVRTVSSGRTIATNKSRKWTPWPLSINSCNIIERLDGTGKLWFGGQATGLIYQVETANLNDDGVAIDAYYQTAWLPGVDKEESLPVGFHRKVFTYMTMFAEGVGNLGITAYSVGSRTAFRLPFIRLRDPDSRDRELLINIPGMERASFRFTMNGVDNWFRLARFCPTVKPDPYSPVRGL